MPKHKIDRQDIQDNRSKQKKKNPIEKNLHTMIRVLKELHKIKRINIKSQPYLLNC